MSDIRRQQANVYFEQAYRHQMRGEYGEAIRLYKRSLELYPTAEAHTFLGWTYGMMQRYEEAIEACHEAIELDPTFGNPYNDIGSYLIEQGEWDEAIPWLEKALMAPRYESPQFPYLNLGRVYRKKGDYKRALAYFNQALEIDPLYRAALGAKFALLGRLN